MTVHTVIDIPDFDEDKVRHHRLEGDVFLFLIVELELARRNIEIDRRQRGQGIILQTGNGNKGNIPRLQEMAQFGYGRRFAGKRNNDKQVVLSQGMDKIAEFFPRRHIVNQNIVIEEEALQFLNDVILHIARRIRKNPIGFMDEGTGPIKIKIADLIDGLGIKSIQPFQGMGIILEGFRLFPFEEQLEFAKAFEAQFCAKRTMVVVDTLQARANS